MNRVGNENKYTSGFTIVELLIVIVVIAILAAITIVAYTGIQERARTSAVQSEIASFAKKIEAAKLSDTAQLYPTAITAFSPPDSMEYYYSALDNSFCIEQQEGSAYYHASSDALQPQEGSCGSDSLLAWLALNENANDMGSESIQGTVTGATLATGQNGISQGAYTFVSGDAVVYDNLSLSNAMKPQPPFSISAWIRPASLSTTVGTIFASDRWVCTTNGYNGYRLYVTSTNISFGIGNGGNCSGNSRYNKAYATSLSLNTWYHFAATITSSLDIQLYLNGQNVGGNYDNGTATTIGYTTNPSRVGSGHGNNETFTGTIDDIRVYNRVISNAEIQGLFNANAQ